MGTRYRIGIDVGLYSVGLVAIEIDDSSEDVYDAMPIKLLSIKSVIHDGALDPDSQKEALSRKYQSGVARRTRRLNKQHRRRLKNLDSLLEELGFPVERAKELVSGPAKTDPYLPWKARISAVTGLIVKEAEKLLALTISILHIARHRGWRNPYSSIDSLATSSADNKRFYIAFFEKVSRWRYHQGLSDFQGVHFSLDEAGTLLYTGPNWDDSAVWEKRLTPAQLVEDMLLPKRGVRIRAEHSYRDIDDLPPTLTQIGKLHSSDYYYEICRMFDMQGFDKNIQTQILNAVFAAKNPRDIGAAAQLVGIDDLAKTEGKRYRRASKASLGFQRFRIIVTLANLRIRKQGESERKLTRDELQILYNYLTKPETAQNSELSWLDIAELLGIQRHELKGVGGQSADGEPVSTKRPPFLSTECAILSVKGINKELTPLKEWWENGDDYDKEALIEYLGNSGLIQENLCDEELAARENLTQLLDELGKLDEESLNKLEGIKLASGRAAYSVQTLKRLNTCMLKENCDLHEARKKEYGVNDDWKPTSEPLGTRIGNPAADRTIKIVSQWLKTVERRWGKPETINIEHIREGFVSPKAAREYEKETDNRYKQNMKIRQEIVDAINNLPGNSVAGPEAISASEVRKWQALARQNMLCLYCGTGLNSTITQMDHIVARKGAGSTNTIDNLVATCENCNKDKNNRLFSKWANEQQQADAILRVESWTRDAYFFNNKQWTQYKKRVIARLKQTEEDEPIDARSIESVAWMARELAEQIRGHFSYDSEMTNKELSPEVEKEMLQRVNVFRGWITSEARKASGIEKKVKLIGSNNTKTRLDRRHHAVDACVVAMMRPAVAQVLVVRDSLKRAQQDLGQPREENEAEGIIHWKKFIGGNGSLNSENFIHWRDDQMQHLVELINNAIEEDLIVVSSPLRLRLGHGRVHQDTIRPLMKRKVGDPLSPINIDKAETPALWMALTHHSDFNPITGLPEDCNRRIRIHDRWLDAHDEIGFLCENEADFQQVKDAVYTKVRGGFAAIGDTVHHARLYRIPKVNKNNKQTGWQYACLRVFQEDLVGHSNEDLFRVEILPQAISRRSALPVLRTALNEGTAEYLGWVVIGDEIVINCDDQYFSPDGAAAINKFMKAFPNTNRFKIVGFKSNSKITLKPLLLSSEGLPDPIVKNDTAETIKLKNQLRLSTYSSNDWSDEDIKAINTVFGVGGSFSPSVDCLCSTHPITIRRNALGDVRWRSNNHMPVSWKIEPHN